MITITTISAQRLGLAAEERQELERLRQVVASIPAQIAKAVDEAIKDAQKEIALLTADVMAIERELTEAQGSAWNNKYQQYLYKNDLEQDERAYAAYKEWK